MARTVNRRTCARPGCGRVFDDPGPGEHRPAPQGYCTAVCHAADRDAVQAARRAERAARVAPGGKVTIGGFRWPISPASSGQRAVVRLEACIVTGRRKGDGFTVDPAHLCPRGRGGCDDPLCIVPLWRPVHRAFDDGRFDLLPYLVGHGLTDHVAHALGHYRGDLVALIERLTSSSWTAKGGAHLLTVEQIEARA